MNIPVNKLKIAKKDCQGIAKIIWVYIVVELLCTLIFRGIDKIHPLDDTVRIVASNFVAILSIGSCVLFASKKYGYKVKKENFRFNFSLGLIPLIVLVIFGLNLMNNLIMLVIQTFLHINVYQEQVVFNGNQIHDISMFMAAVVIAPIFEELMFRGAILRILDRYHHNFAIISSAILFALLHGSLAQWVYTFIFGLILAYLSLKYNSLLLPMLIHCSNNLLAVLVYISEGTFITFVFLQLMICGICATFFLLWQNIHLFRVEKDWNYPYWKYTFGNIWMIFLIIYCFVTLIYQMF